MLEDLAMDKKSASGVRSSQFPAKPGPSNNSDCKKLQDGAGVPKGFHRGPRKRESVLPGPPQNPQHKQRGKAYDKRPRPRGQYNADRKEDPQVEEHRADYESVHSLGRKKVNLNHLLNFHFTPAGNSGSQVGTKNWHHASQRHRFNKEQFLQANCQFVVRAGGDYSRYFNDPDTLVEWDLIEQIRIMTSEPLCCPICLCQPTAARITKCGHVFCWPCILHYLDLGEKSWRKCPICYEAVYKDDMKSVSALLHDEMKIGDIVTLKLMKREKGSLTVVPVQNEMEAQGSADIKNQLCKLIIADPMEAFGIIKKETLELKERLRDEEGTPEICFTEQAVEILEQRKNFLESKSLHGHAVVSKPDTEEINQELVDNASAIVSGESERVRRDTASSEGQLSIKSDDTCEEAARAELQADEINKNRKFFYFYQAEDGQHLYLHPLNVHMLEYMYGSLEASPSSIRGRVVEKEAGSMTAEMRQRLRYLQHLPITCQFEVVELELRPPVVSKQTLECFREQMDTRKKKRQRRAREEHKIEKRVAEEENRHYGRFPSPKVSIESFQHFPECGSSGSPPSASQSHVVEEFEELSLESGSPHGPSFSQMLQDGKRQGAPAWGARFHSSVSAPQLSQQAPEEPDPDGYVPAPSFSQSFGDAFALALQQAENSAAAKGEEPTGRKKKKNKQKVLFTTNMACNSK